jgi:hypothetical protein
MRAMDGRKKARHKKGEQRIPWKKTKTRPSL